MCRDRSRLDCFQKHLSRRVSSGAGNGDRLFNSLALFGQFGPFKQLLALAKAMGGPLFSLSDKSVNGSGSRLPDKGKTQIPAEDTAATKSISVAY
jgi:hypothetical protein